LVQLSQKLGIIDITSGLLRRQQEASSFNSIIPQFIE
jgi:hypothetical protein